jgi:hypothetical protein
VDVKVCLLRREGGRVRKGLYLYVGQSIERERGKAMFIPGLWSECPTLCTLLRRSIRSNSIVCVSKPGLD